MFTLLLKTVLCILKSWSKVPLERCPLLSRFNNLNSFFFHRRVAPTFWLLFWILLWIHSSSSIHVFQVLWIPELDAVLQVRSYKSRGGQSHGWTRLVRLAFCCEDAHWQIIPKFSSTAQVLLLRVVLNPFIPLLNLMRFIGAHSSRLSRSSWMATLPSRIPSTPFSFVSSANLLTESHSLCFRWRLFIVLVPVWTLEGYH